MSYQPIKQQASMQDFINKLVGGSAPPLTDDF